MIIGILGKAGSGKDSLADIFVHKHNFTKIAFADPIKKFCAEILDFSEQQLWGPSENRNKIDPRYNAAPRDFLLKFGTEAGRAVYQDIWVDYTIKIAKQLLSSDIYRYSNQRGLYSILGYEDEVNKKPISGVVCSDIRFCNEFQKLKEAGAILIKIIREGYGMNSSHQSETEQDTIQDSEFDYIINNNGTLLDLENKVHNIISKTKINELNTISFTKLSDDERLDLVKEVNDKLKCKHRFNPNIIGGGCLLCGKSSAAIVKDEYFS